MGLLGRRGQRKAYGAGVISGTEGRWQSAQAGPQIARCDLVQACEHGHDVSFDLDVARDVGAADTKLARGPQDAPERVGRADADGADAALRADPRSCPKTRTEQGTDL